MLKDVDISNINPECDHKWTCYPKSGNYDWMESCLYCKLTVNRSTGEIESIGELEKSLNAEDKEGPTTKSGALDKRLLKSVGFV